MDAHRSDPVVAPHSSGSPATLDDGSATLGQLLRVAREQRRMTLSEISASTNVPLSRLDAFERDDIGDIPLGMYQRAEIRAFADAVGLDPRIALAALERPRPAPVPAEIEPGSAVAGTANTTGVGTTRDPRQIAATVTGRTTIGRAQTRSRLVPLLVALAVLAAGWLALRSLWTPSAGAAQETLAAPAPSTASTSPELRTTQQAGAPDLNTAGRSSADAAPPAEESTATSGSPVELPNLRVVSEPSGARVTVDGIGWGQTPVTIRYLPPGAKRVRLTRDGYTTQEQVVQLSSNAPTTTVRVTLRRRR